MSLGPIWSEYALFIFPRKSRTAEYRLMGHGLTALIFELWVAAGLDEFPGLRDRMRGGGRGARGGGEVLA